MVFFYGVSDASATSEHAHQNPAGSQEIEVVFLGGLADLQRGNIPSAIEKFQSILSNDPTLVRVRLELARSYFLIGQWDRARNEFFTALSGDLPASVRQNVLSYIREIDARRGFDWDLSIGVVAVGNTRKYDTDEIILDFGGIELPFEFARDTSTEIGLRLAGAANFRRSAGMISQNIEATGYATAAFDIVEARGSDYDDYNFTGRFGLRGLAPRTTFSVGPAFTTRFIAGQIYENRAALELAFEHRNVSGTSVFGFLNGASIHNLRASDLDGFELDAEIGVRRSIDGRGIIGMSLALEDKSTDDSLEDYFRKRFTIFGRIDARGGFTIRPSVYAEAKTFHSPSVLFTGNPDERTLGTTIRIQKNDVFIGNGFSPFVQVSYSRTKSGIDAFSYSDSNIEAGVERRF